MIAMTNKLVIDSSKLGDYMRCPRYAFYRHMIGWEHQGNNIHLIFGEAYHRLKEILFQYWDDPSAPPVAMSRFNEYYRRYYSEYTDLDNFPKNPGNAQTAMFSYIDFYSRGLGFKVIDIIDQNGNKVPATEIYGVVPVPGTVDYHFRIDAIVERQDGSIAYVDHKTSGMNNAIYQSQYSISNQMYGYYHVLNAYFGPGQVYGGIIDLTILTKKIQHIRIPIIKSLDMMEEWMHNMRYWMNCFVEDYNILKGVVESINGGVEIVQTMPCFRKNDKGCVAYGKKCMFYDFCIAWPNPLKRVDQLPPGYKVEFWDPSAKEDEDKTFIKVGV